MSSLGTGGDCGAKQAVSIHSLRYGAFFHEVLPIRCFEELKHPLVITTTNLQTGQPCYHERHGDLIEPVIASMSLPGVFPPVWIAGISMWMAV